GCRACRGPAGSAPRARGRGCRSWGRPGWRRSIRAGKSGILPRLLRHKGGAGRIAHMRRGGATTLLVLACLLAAPAAAAGTIWRCDGPDGVISYVSKKVAGAKCTAVSHYKSSPAPSRPASKPDTAAVVTSSATPVAGSKMTNAAPPSGGGSGAGTRRVQGQVYSYIKDGVRHYTS